MKDVIEQLIIPDLKADVTIAQRISAQKKIVFNLVFDRECYEPAFFQRLWDMYQIVVITYRKNAKDKWEENLFQNHTVTIPGNTVTMPLYEKKVELGGHVFREIRCLGEGAHQTAIISTNPDITLCEVAEKMFSRWSQENFSNT